ncbi:hypothetical protein CDA63_02940 [Hymenobacter amundsenii]|uniref:TonB C-terminal domain-containing protein n=1 Tax=Hymenobacter amundsenii TaxID=2006685 RepID=A0A246FPQ2_9BACT|nr:M56 family metallopeptidase [Hymenobacter amundsenii]OWP64731.1 hypothetical protein CDA63_02940 [Hymenobacter amundsenii]
MLLTLLPTTTAALLSWGLQSTLVLGAGWLLYRYALRQERFFDFNRRFLLVLPWVALLAPPLLAVGAPALASWLPTWQPTAGPTADLVGGSLLPTITVRGAPAGPAATDPLPWLLGVYGAGAALLLVRLAAQLWHLHRSTRHFPREPGPGCVLVRTGGQLPISSFGRLVFWDEADLTPAEARAVLAHELAHVRGHHTRERLTLEIARVLLWPVPLMHLLPPALAQLHEFLADAAALRAYPAGTAFTALAATTYPALLARLALAQFGPDLPLAHSFTQSFTLARIRMLTTSASLHRWKRWLPLPVAASLLLGLAACNKELVVATPLPTPVGVYTYVEQMPQYPGGMPQLLNDLGKTAHYPAAALATNTPGRTFVRFIVGTDGTVQAAEITQGAAKPGMDTEVARQFDAAALQAVRELPGKWTPGQQNGKVLPVYYTIPVTFANQAPSNATPPPSSALLKAGPTTSNPAGTNVQPITSPPSRARSFGFDVPGSYPTPNYQPGDIYSEQIMIELRKTFKDLPAKPTDAPISRTYISLIVGADGIIQSVETRKYLVKPTPTTNETPDALDPASDHDGRPA